MPHSFTILNSGVRGKVGICAMSEDVDINNKVLQCAVLSALTFDHMSTFGLNNKMLMLRYTLCVCGALFDARDM